MNGENLPSSDHGRRYNSRLSGYSVSLLSLLPHNAHNAKHSCPALLHHVYVLLLLTNCSTPGWGHWVVAGHPVASASALQNLLCRALPCHNCGTPRFVETANHRNLGNPSHHFCPSPLRRYGRNHSSHPCSNFRSCDNCKFCPVDRLHCTHRPSAASLAPVECS